MEPLSIIKDFDVIKEGEPSLSQVVEILVVDKFCFQRAPEGFHNRVVITVALGTHTGKQFPRMQ